MLRVTIALLIAIAAVETAEGADKALLRQNSHHGWHRTAVILPAGLPRPHYHFRTTISYGPPSGYRRPYGPAPIYQTPEPLYAYDDRGPYYGGPYVPYWDRLPYACSVYGYC
jgi:hypothetical protein